MKKLVKKEHKDKKEAEEEKKERKEREKQEKKEKKERKKDQKKEKKESKKHKKGLNSDSSTSLDSKGSERISASSSSLSKTTTITSGSPGNTTTVVHETTRDEHGERSSATKVEETPTKTTSGETIVKKTTTTVTKSESEPNKASSLSKTTTITSGSPGSTTKTTVVHETPREVHGERSSATKVEETPTKMTTGEAVVKKTTTTVTKSEPEPNKAVESKTVVKNASRSSPGGEEKVVVSKTTTEVQSIPTTRQFLEKNFPEAARFERTRHIQNRVESEDVVPSVDKPSHFSQRTVIREIGDGGHTQKTVTKIVSDEGGTRKTITTTSGGNDDNIISTETNRKVDFPADFLEKRDTSTPRGRATIDYTIKIPSPSIERKEKPRHKPTGPKVIEEIQPSEQKKEDISNFLDDLSQAAHEKPKENASQANHTDNKVTEAIDSLLESAPKTENAIDFVEKTPQKPAKKDDGKRFREREERKFIRSDGDTIETVTETFKNDDGKVERTTTTKKSGNEKKPKNIDMNANILQPEKPKDVPLRNEKDKQDDDDLFVRDDEVIDPDEVFEDILVVEQKRKVRFPKSFLPRKPERPRSWVLPLDLLVERPRSPRKIPHIYGLEVRERVDEKSQKRALDEEDLDQLLTAITEAPK